MHEILGEDSRVAKKYNAFYNILSQYTEVRNRDLSRISETSSIEKIKTKKKKKKVKLKSMKYAIVIQPPSL